MSVLDRFALLLTAAVSLAGGLAAEDRITSVGERWERFITACDVSERTLQMELIADSPDSGYARMITSLDEFYTSGLYIGQNRLIKTVVSGSMDCDVSELPATFHWKTRLSAMFTLDDQQGAAQIGVSVARLSGEGETEPLVDIHLDKVALSFRRANPDAELVYSDSLRSVRSLNRRGVQSLVIQLRTPTDAERFGHHLQSLSLVLAAKSGGVCIRGLCVNPKHFRFHPRSSDELVNWARKDESGSVQSPQLLWHWTYQRHGNDSYSLVHRAACEQIAESMQWMISKQSRDLGLSLDLAEKHMEGMIGLLRVAQSHANQTHDDDKYGVVDDPVMLCRFSEDGLTPQGSYVLVHEILPRVLSIPHLSMNSRAAFCDVLGDLGRPALFDFRFLEGLSDATFMEAILFSRWEWDWTAEHSAACLKVLASEPVDSRAAFAAVESLVRMDEVDNVPKSHLLSWYDHAVCRFGSDFNTAIGILSRQPTGRAFLLTRLGSKERAKIQTTIHWMLKLRAESTQRTKRWDFMTEAECEQILALPAPPTPGKDTEGGPARPFPTDE